MSSLTKTFAILASVVGSSIAYSGDMTYFTPGLGACGWQSSPGEAVVALSQAEYGNYPNPYDSPQCGRWITITARGKWTAARVVDMCPGPECASGAIDVSEVIFDDIADPAEGRVWVDWWFQ